MATVLSNLSSHSVVVARSVSDARVWRRFVAVVGLWFVAFVWFGFIAVVGFGFVAMEVFEFVAV